MNINNLLPFRYACEQAEKSSLGLWRVIGRFRGVNLNENE